MKINKFLVPLRCDKENVKSVIYDKDLFKKINWVDETIKYFNEFCPNNIEQAQFSKDRLSKGSCKIAKIFSLGLSKSTLLTTCLIDLHENIPVLNEPSFVPDYLEHRKFDFNEAIEEYDFQLSKIKAVGVIEKVIPAYFMTAHFSISKKIFILPEPEELFLSAYLKINYFEDYYSFTIKNILRVSTEIIQKKKVFLYIDESFERKVAFLLLFYKSYTSLFQNSYLIDSKNIETNFADICKNALEFGMEFDDQSLDKIVASNIKRHSKNLDLNISDYFLEREQLKFKYSAEIKRFKKIYAELEEVFNMSDYFTPSF